MKRTLLLTALLACCVPAMASDKHKHDDDGCGLNVEYGVKLMPDRVELSSEAGKRFVLQQGKLTLDGRDVALTAKERDAVLSYEKHTRDMVPQVAGITVEALAIANEAVTLAMSAMLGPDDPALKKMKNSFSEITKNVTSRVTATQLPISDQDWPGVDAQIEDAAEEMAGAVLGSVFATLGNVGRLMFDEDYRVDFEKRMNKMEKDMEARVEARAESLEPKAKALCQTLTAMDALEVELSKSNKALSGFNMVDPSKGRNKKLVIK